MASIRKKGNNYYIKFFTSDLSCELQKEKNFSLKTSNKREAEKLKELLEDDYAKGLLNPFAENFRFTEYMRSRQALNNKAHGVTLQELCKLFIEERANLRTATIDAYERHFKMMKDEWGSTLPVRFISEQMVRDFCFKPSLQPATQKSYLTHLKVFFGWLKRKGFHSENVAQHIKAPRIGDQKLKKIMDNQKFNLLLLAQSQYQAQHKEKGFIKTDAQKQGWFRPLMCVYYYAGLRLQEGINLRWSQVDFANEDLHIINSAQARTKSGKDRTVHMHPELYNELYKWHELQGKPLNGLVFPSPSSIKYHETPLNSGRVSKTFKRFSRMAGLSEDYTTHSLRHSFVTNLIHAGVPLPMVQQLAGHGDIGTTMCYSHLTPNEIKNKLKSLGL